MPAFTELNQLNQAEIDNLNQLGYSQMTAIQEKSLPHALNGQDLIAQAKTGSGKTAAFGIPLLHKLNQRFFGVQALVLCPTRELASQVADELRKLARFQANIKIVVLCGGVGIGPQIASMEKGAHVVVGTPGRIQDHLRKGTLQIDQVETLVLDEADRMLDMGFYEEISQIVAHTPKARQTLLFSATYPDNIAQLSADLQREPVSIKVESTHQATSIEQHLLISDGKERNDTLFKAIRHFDIQQAVIFCNTKQSVEDLSSALKNQGFTALALHGDMEQRDRDEIYVRFKNNSSHFLVATDVAARGLDVNDLPAVINYELPRDPEVYVHRIGRTGRAGKSGLALSLASPKEDYKIAAIEDQIKAHVPKLDVDKLVDNQGFIPKPAMITLCFAAGKKDKLRPGDILGALTGKDGIDGKQVGKIDVLDYLAYVAVERKSAAQALEHLQKTRIKNKNIRVRRV
ncbi:MAG: ATP-dependent RNA helicase DbpA [Venatoribacter sp.]